MRVFKLPPDDPEAPTPSALVGLDPGWYSAPDAAPDDWRGPFRSGQSAAVEAHRREIGEVA